MKKECVCVCVLPHTDVSSPHTSPGRSCQPSEDQHCRRPTGTSSPDCRFTTKKNNKVRRVERVNRCDWFYGDKNKNKHVSGGAGELNSDQNYSLPFGSSWVKEHLFYFPLRLLKFFVLHGQSSKTQINTCDWQRGDYTAPPCGAGHNPQVGLSRRRL